MPLRISKSGSTVTTFKILNFDSDAQTFLTAAGITNSTQQNAINKLTIDLKYYGLWTKMKALYPIVGGTSAAHAVNLRTPGTYNLSFTAGWTHSLTGMTPNGTSDYANTNLNMSTNYSVNDSTHISFYSRTASANSTDYEMGVYNGSTVTGLSLRRSDGANSTYFGINTNAYISFTDSNAAAFYISNRLGTAMNGWRNSTKMVANTNTALTRPNLNMFIGNLNVNGTPDSGLWSTRQCAFASIGDGLTDQDRKTSVIKIRTNSSAIFITKFN